MVLDCVITVTSFILQFNSPGVGWFGRNNIAHSGLCPSCIQVIPHFFNIFFCALFIVHLTNIIVVLQFSNWWPLMVVLFYIFALVPTFMSRRYVQSSYLGGSNSCQEVSIFITMGFVISAFALPLVLARSSIVSLHHLITHNWCTPTITFHPYYLFIWRLRMEQRI